MRRQVTNYRASHSRTARARVIAQETRRFNQSLQILSASPNNPFGAKGALAAGKGLLAKVGQNRTVALRFAACRNETPA
jgi:hypothetical protein